jgi:hypothetical protein
MSQHRMAARRPTHSRAATPRPTTVAAQPRRTHPRSVHPKSVRPVALGRRTLPPVRPELHSRAPQWDGPMCVVSPPPANSPVAVSRAIRPASVIPSVKRSPRRRLFAFVLVVIAATLWCASSAIATQGGYGPGITGPTGPANAPGGYSEIATTHTFTPTGGVLDANVAGGKAHLTVPKNAFGHTVQVEITTPTLDGIQGALQQLGFGEYSAVGGIGVKVYNTNGTPFVGNFAHPLTLTISGPAIVSGGRLIKFASPSSAALAEAVFTPGSVTTTLMSDPDFAVLAPGAATSPTTPPAAAAIPSAEAGGAAPSASAPTIVKGEQFTKSNSSNAGRILLLVTVVAVCCVAVAVVLRRRQLRVADPYGFAPKRAQPRRAEPKHSEPKHASHATASPRQREPKRNSLRTLEPKHSRR